MAEVKFTKTELRSQQLKLDRLRKYLPTLQLKKAMLQMEVNLAQVEIEYSGFSRHPDVGLVKNPDEELIAELKEIALL